MVNYLLSSSLGEDQEEEGGIPNFGTDAWSQLLPAVEEVSVIHQMVDSDWEEQSTAGSEEEEDNNFVSSPVEFEDSETEESSAAMEDLEGEAGEGVDWQGVIEGHLPSSPFNNPGSEDAQAGSSENEEGNGNWYGGQEPPLPEAPGESTLAIPLPDSPVYELAMQSLEAEEDAVNPDELPRPSSPPATLPPILESSMRLVDWGTISHFVHSNAVTFNDIVSIQHNLDTGYFESVWPDLWPLGMASHGPLNPHHAKQLLAMLTNLDRSIATAPALETTTL
ncbi:hypothetical protein BJ508DRAFT_336931 [Ascobolus immersus RN42]|uniref:Uncharacterized protein n=1 Tax=Ascobolus immersus RN42 TaxID=1160509 RepID=A0A3N4HER2_ASCIM|nr:hypothetical protein BJ508DRAFT_336931 [Ascobolus immersus RN42]